MTIGIYRIHHKISNSTYIGQSTDIKRRWQKHLQELKNKTHHNLALQYLWIRSSEVDFEFEVLEAFEKFNSPIAQQEMLAEREAFFIKLFSQKEGIKCINLNFGGYVETNDATNESLLNNPNSKWHLKNRLSEILEECKDIDEFLVLPRPDMVKEKIFIEKKKAFIAALYAEYSGIRVLKNIFKPSKLKIHKEALASYERIYIQKYGQTDKRLKTLRDKKEKLLLEIQSLRSKID